MAIVKLVAGAVSAWTAIMTTELNALASGNAIRGSTSIDNGTNNDQYIEFSFVAGGSITTTGSPFLAIYHYYLNGDGTSYGDGRYGSAAAGPPHDSTLAGRLGTLLAGAGTVTGTFSPLAGFGGLIPLRRGIVRPVLHNGLGVALAASGNILYYRTVNLQIV